MMYMLTKKKKKKKKKKKENQNKHKSILLTLHPDNPSYLRNKTKTTKIWSMDLDQTTLSSVLSAS